MAVAAPFVTFTLSGLDEPVSLPLSFIVIPFSLKIRFPSFTLLLLVSVTVAFSVSFSPIIPLVVCTVVFVFFIPLSNMLFVIFDSSVWVYIVDGYSVLSVLMLLFVIIRALLFIVFPVVFALFAVKVFQLNVHTDQIYILQT